MEAVFLDPVEAVVYVIPSTCCEWSQNSPWWYRICHTLQGSCIACTQMDLPSANHRLAGTHIKITWVTPMQLGQSRGWKRMWYVFYHTIIILKPVICERQLSVQDIVFIQWNTTFILIFLCIPFAVRHEGMDGLKHEGCFFFSLKEFNTFTEYAIIALIFSLFYTIIRKHGCLCVYSLYPITLWK